MNKTKVVILNGPPCSGKDVLAQSVVSSLGEDGVHMEYKSKLYSLVMNIYDIDKREFFEIYNDRELKEAEMDVFGGISVRQAMIKVSEDVIKPNYGEGYFGDSAAKRLKKGKINVFSDGGFFEETQSLIKKVGLENVLLVKIYRPGCSFEGDSRNYLPDGIVPNAITLHNEGSLDNFLEKGEQIARWVL